jgi:circadian clock protein KaiC
MRAGTGIPGLDEVLLGGLRAHRLYLVEGSPGTGKTTLALQFLQEGRRLGEKVLYITLSETREELVEIGQSHGWTLEGVEIYELDQDSPRLKPEENYTVFHPEEVELNETTQHVYSEVERIGPSRVVLDSLAELRLLTRDPLRYRRQILMLKQFFVGRRCTVLLLDDTLGRDSELQVQSIAHGVLGLERLGMEYGVPRRRLTVQKLRGARFRDGYHDYVIQTGGLQVFPRLVAAEHRATHNRSAVSSGIPEFDALLGGGLRRGTSTLIIGPAGAGKSTLASAYVRAVAQRGERTVAYAFEESRQMFLDRMSGVGMDLSEYVENGLIEVRQIDPAELSPGEFSQRLRDQVEQRDVKLVLIDSLNGYLGAMPSERFLLVHLHELLSYLSEKGVLTILVVAQQGTIGDMHSPVEISYLADTLVLLRFFEKKGALKKAVSVVKHRMSAHEDTIREMWIARDGVHVGKPLHEFQGILRGAPEFVGSAPDPRCNS